MSMRCALRTSSLLHNFANWPSHLPCKQFARYKNTSLIQNRNWTDEEGDIPQIFKSQVPMDVPSCRHQLSLAKTCEEVLRLVQEKKKKDMNIKDAILFAEKIYRIAKSMPEKDLAITKSKDFIKLCEFIHENLRSIDGNDALSLRTYLVHPKIGVPENSMISQSLLQLIYRDIKHLSFNSVIFLSNVLKRQTKTVISQAISKTLPTLFEASMEKELPYQSFKNLAKAYHFAATEQVSQSSLDYIIDLIHSRIEEMTYDEVALLSIAISLTKSSSPSYLKVKEKFLDFLVDHVSDISYKSMKKVSWNLGWNTRKADREFYHEKFLDAFVEKMIQEDRGFQEAVETLKYINHWCHSHIPLLDYIANECFKYPKIIEEANYSEIFAFLEGLCTSGYKPIFWEAIQDRILVHPIWHTEAYYKRARIAFKLHLLGCQDKKMLHSILKEVKTNDRHVLLEIMMLDKNIKALNPSYLGPSLSDAQVQSIIQQHEPSRSVFPLEKPLQVAFGGPEYVLTNVSSKYKKCIDHVIVMRQGGFPIAINLSNENKTEEKVNLENMVFPIGSQVIIILVPPRYAYTSNTCKLIAEWSMMIKSLETLLYPIVPICSKTWDEMLEKEKIPNLMKAIRLKCEEISPFIEI